METINARELFELYERQFKNIINRIRDDKERAIPYIVIKVTTQIVPSMAQTLGDINTLTGTQKKQMIIDAVELAIDETFKELNELPELASVTWDDDLKELLLTLIGPVLTNLIDVEKGQLVFNTTTNKLNFYTGAAWESVTSA